MKYLVIGASGQVGRQLMKLIPGAVGTGHTRAAGMIALNLADAMAVKKTILDIKPDGVFVPGGVTAVDWCEKNEAQARKICVDGTAAIRDATDHLKIPAVHFSTDYVFSGHGGPYGEAATPDPVSAYGRVKLEGERAAGNAIILRTSMVYSADPTSANFHNFVMSNLSGGSPIKAFSDQKGSPTYAPALAQAALEAMERRMLGLWQVAGPEVLTRLDMARRISRAYGLNETLIQAVTSEEFPLAAVRPKEGGLRIEKARGTFRTPFTSLDEALEKMRT